MKELTLKDMDITIVVFATGEDECDHITFMYGQGHTLEEAQAFFKDEVVALIVK